MRIVVGVGPSKQSAQAVCAAIAIARRTDAELVLVHAPVMLPTSAWLDGLDPSRELLDAKVSAAVEAGIRASGVFARGYFPAAAIAEIALQDPADLVIVGTRSRWLGRLGASPTLRLARSLPMPVLAVRAAQPFAEATPSRPLRLLLALDLTEAGDAAVEWTRSLATTIPSRVTAAFSIDPFEARKRFGIEGPVELFSVDHRLRLHIEPALEAQVQTLRDVAEVETFLQPNLGRTSSHLELIAHESGCDLIVAASHQHPLPKRLLDGATSRQLLADGDCSVCSVPVAWRAASAARSGRENVAA